MLVIILIVGCGRGRVLEGRQSVVRTAALSNEERQYSLPRMSGTPAKPHVGRLVSLLAMAAIAPAPGCCGLARYFCGPDESVWVQESYGTPEQAVATFREAVRRADAEILQRCLGEAFKRRTGLVGVLEAELAWRKIEDEVPGLHVLGYASIQSIEITAPDRAVARLALDGNRVELGLVRQPYWEVRWNPTEDIEDLERDGRYVSTAREILGTGASPDGLGTSISLRIPTLGGTIDRADQVEFAGFGQEWKIDGIGQPADG